MEILSLPYLKKRLQSPAKRVRMWAAYHLAERWQENAAEFVGMMLESDVPEIKESGIYLVGRRQLHEFAFPLLRIFNHEVGALKTAAVVALTEIQYSTLERSLGFWLEELFAANEVNYQALQGATRGYLSFEGEKNWWKLNEKVPQHYQHHIKSLALFGALSEGAQTPEQLAEITKHYSIYRHHFTDPQFLNFLFNIFDNGEMVEFLRLRTQQGYSMRLIYEEGLNILGWNPSHELLQILDEVDAHCAEKTLEALPRLLNQAIGAMLAHESPFFEEQFLEQFKTILSHWGETIVKVQDQEFFFILSLPLTRFVKEAENACLASPENHATQIAGIYHSPLLRLTFMTRIINLLAKTPFPESNPTVYSPSGASDTPREALWKLVSHQTLLEDYPFALTLPNPWDYDIPFLQPRLLEIYKHKLEHCLASGQHGEVGYALELFKRAPDEEIVELMLRHFTPLINQHFYLFFEFMECLPDPRFIAKLIQHHREGEKEIQQLIELLCDIHQQPHPFADPTFPEKTDRSFVRVLCPECQTSYRYPIGVLYFDQEALEQRHVFTHEEIWTPENLTCKNCNADLPLQVEAQFLTNLYTEMLAAHLLKVSEEEQKAIATYKPLIFPRYFGKKTNPGNFLKKAKADLNAQHFSPKEQSQLLLEIGKLYLAMEQFSQAQTALQKSLELAGDQPWALFHLGVVAFHQKNIYEARLHFSHFLQLHSASDFESEEKNLYHQANHYLEILNHREFKRSTFKLLS